MNYTELKTAVEDYTENTFTSVDFATMTKFAEQKVYNSVQLPATRKNVTSNLTTGNKYVSAPDDFLSVFSLAVIDLSGVYTYLLNKDVNFIREAYSTDSAGGTVPKYYAIFGNNSSVPNELSFIVGPTPNAGVGYTLELHYYAYPASIVTASTSWLGDNFDSVLFNAVMMEAIRFMKGEPDLVALYADQYKQALTLLKNLVDGKQRQDAYRSGQLRTQVI